jgi:hypothetical protein
MLIMTWLSETKWRNLFLRIANPPYLAFDIANVEQRGIMNELEWIFKIVFLTYGLWDRVGD